MKNFFTSVKGAALVLLVVVLLTVLAVAPAKLAARRGGIDRLFAAGDTGAGSIASDLAARAECAGNLLIIAGRCGQGESSAAEALQAALSSAQREGLSRGEQYSADQALAAAEAALYEAAEGWALSETDRSLVEKQHTAFLSAGETMAHESYNEQAAAFNAGLQGFPASLYAALFGIEPLELFG